MRTGLRRWWPAWLAGGVVFVLVDLMAYQGYRLLVGPGRDHAVGTWRSGAGTVVRLYADGTARGELLPAEENCWRDLGERVPYSASGTWKPQQIDSVGPGVMLTLTADGATRSCHTALAYSDSLGDERLVFTDDGDLNPMAKD